MLDHMLFNLQKWFTVNDDTTTAKINGRSWRAYPQTITLEANFDASIAGGEGRIRLDGDTTYPCLGSIDGYYAIKGHPGTLASNYGLLLVPESYVISVNWGGNPSLIRLYQRFRSLLYPTREVA